MPRNGSGIYSTPPGTDGIPDNTIASTPYNFNVHDVESDLNFPRPIVAGGTGSSTAAGALANLGGVSATGGGTITGPLVLRGAAPQISLDATGAGINMISGLRNTLNRWLLQLGNNVAETGGNTGSEFNLYGYDDNGTTGWGVLNVNRNTKVTSQYLPTKFVDTTASGSSTTGAVTIAGGLGVAGVVNTNGAINAAGTITTSASLSFATSLFIGGTQFVSRDANYNYLAGRDGVTHLALGSSAIGLNTHFQTAHQFQNNSGVIQCTIDNTGVAAPLFKAGAGVTATGGVINVTFGAPGPTFGMSFRPTADSAFPIAFYNAAGTQVGYILTSASATTYSTSSDIRLKEDFQQFDSGPIIDGSKAYDFAWRVDGTRAHGVIAQEARTVYSEAVTEGPDGYLSVDYSKYVPVLLQELKLLRARVAALEGTAAPR